MLKDIYNTLNYTGKNLETLRIYFQPIVQPKNQNVMVLNEYIAFLVGMLRFLQMNDKTNLITMHIFKKEKRRLPENAACTTQADRFLRPPCSGRDRGIMVIDFFALLYCQTGLSQYKPFIIIIV